MPVVTPNPFALSLSKGFPSPSCAGRREGEGFDKLSPNGSRRLEGAL
jgi:hypothetical protein